MKKNHTTCLNLLLQQCLSTEDFMFTDITGNPFGCILEKIKQKKKESIANICLQFKRNL